jgi:hypothetical protein
MMRHANSQWHPAGGQDFETDTDLNAMLDLNEMIAATHLHETQQV